jgi:hypothetical protein
MERIHLSTGLLSYAALLGGVALTQFMLAPAFGQTAPAPAAAPQAGAAVVAPAPAPAAPAAVSLLAPGMNGILAWPSNPTSVDVGPLGTWYLDAALTGLVLAQDSRVTGDRSANVDLSNGQLFLQKVDGWWQFYVQAGGYSIPALGTFYTPNDASHTSNNYYGVVPQAFLKLVPTDNTYIQFGKLPTLIGAESTFTFENMNIERGLLWNQEPAVSRGVQIGYTLGPVAFSASLNDGYYSNRYNWLSGSAAWTINPHNTLTFAAGGNIGHTGYQESPYATPIAQNNSSIYNIIYTYNNSPFLIVPYLQFSHVDKNLSLGIDKTTNSYAGAILASYAFTDTFSLAARGEYIGTDGSNTDGSANLLYGPGSKAYSLTLTPTVTFKKLYLRADASWVHLSSETRGDGFGTSGNATDQLRGLIEAGVLF